MISNTFMRSIFAILMVVILASCSREPKIKIETEFGDMVMTLREDTPRHRENFLKLVKAGFYDDLLFHRVMGGFMIQGGDPGSKDAPAGKPLGGGGPGYTIPAEFTGGLHIKGAVAAARLSDKTNPAKDSSGSQFYIVQGTPINENTLDGAIARNPRRKYTPEQRQAYLDAGAGTPFLDDEYTVFGQVIEGLDVIDKIAAQQVNPMKRPIEDIKMTLSIIN